MSDLRTCTLDNKEEFDSWLLSIGTVAQLMDSDPNEICFAKAEGNLLKLLYSVISKDAPGCISKRKCEKSSPQ